MFAEYKKIDSTGVLVLVGDGASRANIERQIGELSLSDSVILLGIRNDVPALLNAFGVTIQVRGVGDCID